jgi:hypothetical protein
LETLALSFWGTRTADVKYWIPFIQDLLAFPLDTQMMPSLRVLELECGATSLEAVVKDNQASHKDDMVKLLVSLGSLAGQFEERGVCSSEIRRNEIYHPTVLMQQVIAACQKLVL